MKSTNRLILILVFPILILSGCSGPSVVKQNEAKPDKTTTAGKEKPAKKKVNPRAESAFKLAVNAIEQGNEDHAIAILDDMANSFPELSGSHVNLGLIYFKRGDDDRAEAAFQKAISIKANNPVAHNHLGIIYRRKGRFDDAEKAYLQAIQFKPDYANAHLNIGILYDIYLRKLSKALQEYEQYQTLTGKQDSTVKKWIIGLKRRIKRSK